MGCPTAAGEMEARWKEECETDKGLGMATRKTLWLRSEAGRWTAQLFKVCSVLLLKIASHRRFTLTPSLPTAELRMKAGADVSPSPLLSPGQAEPCPKASME